MVATETPMVISVYYDELPDASDVSTSDDTQALNARRQFFLDEM
jgi:hypothetical protein